MYNIVLSKMIKGFQSGIKGELGVEGVKSYVSNYIKVIHSSYLNKVDKGVLNFISSM